MTAAETKKLKEIKNDPRLKEDIKGLTDDEILALWRFNGSGGTTGYSSEEEWRAARKKRGTDTIEEV